MGKEIGRKERRELVRVGERVGRQRDGKLT